MSRRPHARALHRSPYRARILELALPHNKALCCTDSEAVLAHRAVCSTASSATIEHSLLVCGTVYRRPITPRRPLPSSSPCSPRRITTGSVQTSLSLSLSLSLSVSLSFEKHCVFRFVWEDGRCSRFRTLPGVGAPATCAERVSEHPTTKGLRWHASDNRTMDGARRCARVFVSSVAIVYNALCNRE